MVVFIDRFQNLEYSQIVPMMDRNKIRARLHLMAIVWSIEPKVQDVRLNLEWISNFGASYSRKISYFDRKLSGCMINIYTKNTRTFAFKYFQKAIWALFCTCNWRNIARIQIVWIAERMKEIRCAEYEITRERQFYDNFD